MAVVVGFYYDVIKCELARQGVRRGASVASCRGVWAHSAVGLTSILHRGHIFYLFLSLLGQLSLASLRGRFIEYQLRLG